ncbi:MAG: WD40 repeat domain-containing protein, partial [Gammaproteobacteria bacterium]
MLNYAFKPLLQSIKNNHCTQVLVPGVGEKVAVQGKKLKPLATWTGHTSRVDAVMALPDGTVVSGSHDNTLRHWDPQTGQCLNTWTGHTYTVSAVTVLPDGTVVSGSRDNTLRHWDPQTGQCLNTWRGHTGWVRAVTVLPDGTVVSGSWDKTLRH